MESATAYGGLDGLSDAIHMATRRSFSEFCKMSGDLEKLMYHTEITDHLVTAF